VLDAQTKLNLKWLLSGKIRYMILLLLLEKVYEIWWLIYYFGYLRKHFASLI
jgi:hypothetical protein